MTPRFYLFFILSITFYSLLPHISSAQIADYEIKKDDFRYNFYDVCKTAEIYFKQKGTGKGSGFTPFERWKYENEGKYFPSGNRLVNHQVAIEEYERLLIESNNSQRFKLFPNGWNYLGPDTLGKITQHYSPGLGRLEFVTVNPSNHKQIYLGSRSGGLWVTQDGGKTWAHHTDMLPASGVNAICPNPFYFDSLYINVRMASSGNSFGIYGSPDGGKTFYPTLFNAKSLGFGGLGSNFKIYVMKFHPRLKNIVFVGTDRGIFRTTDQFKTWTRLNNTWDVIDIEFHPTQDSVLYLYENDYWGTNKNRIQKSVDLGNSYAPLQDMAGNNDERLNITTTAICPNCIFLTSNKGIWISEDQGATWKTRLSTVPSGVSLANARPSDTDTSKYVGGYVDLFRSDDNGFSFSKCTYWSLGDTNHGPGNFQYRYFNSNSYIHADCNYLTCVNGIFYACTDGFLCSSSDNGKTWQRLSLNNGIRENYNLGISQSNHAKTMCGAQDNGTIIKTDSFWLEYSGADGMECIIHPLNDNLLIGSYQYGSRNRSLDGGLSHSGVTPKGQNGYWIAPMFWNPNNHMQIYSLGNMVHKSDDFGDSWQDLGTPSSFGGQPIQYAAMAENNSNLLVAARNDQIELSKDGGNTFSSIKGNLPGHNITDVAFDPKNDSCIVVVNQSYQKNQQKIYITFDLGTTWNNITYNLGDMPLLSVAIDHTNLSNIYVGAEIGVYRKTMNDTVWTLFNQGLPNVAIKELEIQYGSNTIRAATWGRGLWEYSLYGRENYPAIVYTTISNPPGLSTPKVKVPQYVTSNVVYTGTLKEVYVLWVKDYPDFSKATKISMNLVNGNTYMSKTPLPDDTIGRKIFFKVIAEGNQSDVSETYRFMYTLKPFETCKAAGESIYGNLYMKRFMLSNVDNDGTANDSFTFYQNLTINLYKDSSYQATGEFNTGWAENDFIVWIDFNGDAEFSMNERVIFDLNTQDMGQGNFMVPQNAITGLTRLRVRLGYWGNYNSACGVTLGEVEDYPVMIKSAAGPNQINSIPTNPCIVFPNPACHEFYLDCQNNASQFIEIYNLVGQKVWSGNASKSQPCNISALPSGVYILKNGEVTLRIEKI